MAFNTIPEIIDDIRAGRMVVMLDDEARENEGDLIMAASHVRPEDINFMVHEARGLVCLALSAERSERLGLKPMVSDNRALHHTNFTVSIEAATGVTTGISAFDRARTIQAAVSPDASAQDLVQPGHVFPLVARTGGVLRRAGHTEAATDLARLAGLEPAATLVEVLREDGHMARRADLEPFVQQHGLKIGTIADLIRYRMATEKTVQRVHEGDVDTSAGRFHLVAWRDVLQPRLHFSLTLGDVADGNPVLTRVHVRSTLTDCLQLTQADASPGIAAVLECIAREGRGALVVLAGEETPETVLAQLQGQPVEYDEANHTRGWRQLGLGAQILGDLGVQRLRVVGVERKLVGLSGFGLEVVEWCAPDASPCRRSA